MVVVNASVRVGRYPASGGFIPDTLDVIFSHISTLSKSFHDGPNATFDHRLFPKVFQKHRTHTNGHYRSATAMKRNNSFSKS